MDKILFKEKVSHFIINNMKNKNKGLSQIEWDTHLWDCGLVDSFRMVELIMYLEDILTIEIDIENNYLSNFHTLEKMYNSLVPEIKEEQN